MLQKTLKVPWNTGTLNLQNTGGSASPSILPMNIQDWFPSGFCPPDSKNWFIGKDPDAGKDWRQEEKVMTEDEMIGWLHQLSRHEFEQALGVGDGQGSLACCSSWGCKESDMTEWLNWTEPASKQQQPLYIVCQLCRCLLYQFWRGGNCGEDMTGVQRDFRSFQTW